MGIVISLAYCLDGMLKPSPKTFFGGVDGSFLWIYTSIFLALFIILDRITNSHAVRIVSIIALCYPLFDIWKWISKKNIMDVTQVSKDGFYASDNYYRLIGIILIILILYLTIALIKTFKQKRHIYRRAKFHVK